MLLAACERPLAPRALSATDGGVPAHLVTIPAKGTATSLDVANWNVEWFGDAGNGPTNESLQQSNVRDVIAGTDADVWGLEEVVSRTAWDNLIAGLPGYAGVLANDQSVVNGPQYYSDFSNTEQKVGLIYKTSVATVRSAKIILTASDYDFAGRPPMEVQLTTTVNGTTQDVVVIVLHMKAGADDASWQRRRNAATALKNYLDTTYPTQKVFVIGDWNDDVDTSILAGSATPYANFVSDGARYTYPTKALSDARISSSVNYPDFIDHQLATNEQYADYVAGSAEAYRVDQYISGYGTNTSDHYPVISRWNVSGGGGTPNTPPTASFSSSCTDLACTFTDGSTDPDGTIASRSWTFGDGSSATAQNPTHSYAAAGSYTVSLTVADNAGATATTSSVVTVTAPPSSGITLTASGSKYRGSARVALTWSGATGTVVDLYRNGAKVATPANSGSYTDVLGKVSGTFTYKVCNTGTTTCSNNASATF